MRASRKGLRLSVEECDGLGDSRLVDVRFDGHRVWSKRLPEPIEGVVEIAWPRALREKLHGRTRIDVEDTTTGSHLVGIDTRFGLSRERVKVTDKRGQWMAMTKWDRLGPVLEGSGNNVAERLLSSATKLVGDMQAWGYPVYIVGGTLLGIIRNGAMLPHDDDIDLAFLSDEWHPADLGRVSYEMERQLVDAGYTVVRHSLAQLEIVFFDSTGEIDHYIDIFTGFFRDGLYCQPFALRGPEVTREDLVPTRILTVNGVDLPAPANPEAWLRYAYGENWRVPDPTFKFVVPTGTKYRFNSWFGIFNRGRYFWEKLYQGRLTSELAPRTEEDVEDFLSMIPARSNVLDLGSGDGAASELIAAAGHRVVGIDFAYEALRVADKGPENRAQYLRVNLNDRPALLALAAHVVRTREVWHVFMRDTIHGLTHVNRENVFMFLAAALRADAIAYVTFYNSRTADYRRSDPRTWSYADERLTAATGEHGLRVVTLRPGRRVKWRPRTIAVLQRSAGARAQRTSWVEERDEDIQ